jgi:hypothetical protein
MPDSYVLVAAMWRTRARKRVEGIKKQRRAIFEKYVCIWHLPGRRFIYCAALETFKTHTEPHIIM